MSRDDIQKLLGGYATGTLTPEEQQALFEAALSDQELFDALAREEPLRAVLSDAASRAHLLAAIDDGPEPWYRRWWRPVVVMATAVLLVAGIEVWEHRREPEVPQVAKVELRRFVPPVQNPSTPMLPPPPEVKRAAPAFKELPLPAASTPAAPAPPAVTVGALRAPAAAPPPAAAPVSQDDALSVNGAVSGMPMQQQAPQQTPPQAQPPFAAQARLQSPQAMQFPGPSGNRMFARDSVAVLGTVTDTSGAAIPSASVAVKSVETGTVVNATTDAKGQFTASGAPGGTVEISASAAGFRSATVREATPQSGQPEPVNLKLQTGTATETVEVTASASTMPTMSARAGFGGAAAEMKAKVAPPPEFPYHLLRRTPGGELMEVRAGETVPMGSTLILRAMPAADGYLRIVEDGRTIANPKVKRNVTSETALPAFDKAGRVEVQVYFSRQARESKSQAAAPAFTVAINIQ